MDDKKYKWKRFWSPIEHAASLSDGGFLVDPEWKWGNIYNPNCVSFVSISHIRCLVLLGEPGIGKTSTIEESVQSIEGTQKTLHIDLRSFSSELSFDNRLFKHPELVAWQNGDYDLHLFLDSLDECLLSMNTAAAFLADVMKMLPIKRLFLRIACRTADWPMTLGSNLERLWDEDKDKTAYKVYRLAPLRMIDVIEAAKENGIDGDIFVRQIQEKAVVPLATKPVTLKILINQYKKNGYFPTTQRELYLQGCQTLCEETNPSRIESNKIGKLTPLERLKIASRIAAIMVFSNRYAIWTDVDYGNVPDEDVSIKEISYGGMLDIKTELVIKEVDIKETLATGLFSARGQNRLGWAHQTYAEFLAAYYFIDNKIPIKHIINLIKHPNDPEGKLVPQLYEVSAWLATMCPDVFSYIMNVEPQVLLRSDVANVDPEDKRQLVHELLRAYEEERLFESNYEFERYYRKLNHPDLGSQLSTVILDRSKDAIVRGSAIEMAQECQIFSLVDMFVKIALDSEEKLQIRVKSSYVVKELGNREQRLNLFKLTYLEDGEDPYDQLKGVALLAAWPDVISAEEMFSVLTKPKRWAYSGEYQTFISRNLFKHFDRNHIPAALEWIIKDLNLNLRGYTFYNELIKNIMKISWDNLDYKNVLELMVSVIYKTVDSSVFYYLNFINDLEKNEQRRRLILQSIIRLINDEEKELNYLFIRRLIQPNDFEWLIDKYLEAKTEHQYKWAHLIRWNFDSRKPEQVKLLYAISTNENNYILAKCVNHLFSAMDLQSTEVLSLKEKYYLKQKEMEQKIIIDHSQSIIESIENLLNKLDKGNLDAWWELNITLSEGKDELYKNNISLSNLDLTKFPGWEIVDEIAKQQIIEAAKKYIIEYMIDEKEFLQNPHWYDPASSAVRGLWLIWRFEPQFIQSLSPKVWKKWASTIVTIQTGSGGYEDVRKSFLKIAYPYVKKEVVNTLLQLIDKENEKISNIHFWRGLETCCDDYMSSKLLEKIEECSIESKIMGGVLSFLLKQDVKGALEFGNKLVTRFVTDYDNSRRPQAIIATQKLFMDTSDASWDVSWPIFQHDPEFGREVITGIARNKSSYRGYSHFNERQLSELYIWMVEQFPFKEDPTFDNENMGHVVTPREKVAEFRDNIIRVLENRGTVQAYEELARIQTVFPELTWLKYSIYEAKSTALRHEWIPPNPVDIITLADHAGFGLVQSGEQLLDILIEVFNKIQEDLNGQTPEIGTLWDEWGKRGEKKSKPISENDFSDFITRHLQRELERKGVIINREVEIKSSRYKYGGERTDIHVNAVTKDRTNDQFKNITVIIEVKGNWHPDLKTAMENQLAERYLKGNHHQYGLYLVGWFESNYWIDEDRKKKVPKMTIDQAREFFNGQATNLSKNGLKIRPFVMDARN
ncbi:NACHT domain-containing protein [Brevibacillus dissolubilis]|uniref:NACHT domain-containing protein n=1 Tax=Brevibacillus dissolubilis TaxID=1844116 RepID=UPI0011179CCF|nr:hypothetical protein [Brevibacillus dissolubilis]